MVQRGARRAAAGAGVRDDQWGGARADDRRRGRDLLVNGVAHLLASLATASYSPGPITGVVLDTGCEQIAAHLNQDTTIGRCLLMTDGQANQGMTDPSELARHAAELRQRGVVTSTFGIGSNFNERLLQEMATAGGGQPYFVATAANIRDQLTSEIGEALEVTERDVELGAGPRPAFSRTS